MKKIYIKIIIRLLYFILFEKISDFIIIIFININSLFLCWVLLNYVRL